MPFGDFKQSPHSETLVTPEEKIESLNKSGPSCTNGVSKGKINSNWAGRSVSPTTRTLGRQKRIIGTFKTFFSFSVYTYVNLFRAMLDTS